MSSPEKSPHFVTAIARAEQHLANFKRQNEEDRDYRTAALGFIGIVTDAYTAFLNDVFLDHTKQTVVRGPFQGMRYHRQATEYSTIPALIGAMECELHEAIEMLIARAPTRIVNVGCGNGYYTVGFAMRLPEAQIIGVDIDPTSRVLTHALAEANGVAERITVEALSTHDSLQVQLGKGTALFMDCEGAERDLLDPAKIPALKDTAVIVEMHDFMFQDVKLTRLLIERFRETHGIMIKTSGTPDGFSYPETRGLGPYQRWVALNEGRPFMHWMIAFPK